MAPRRRLFESHEQAHRSILRGGAVAARERDRGQEGQEENTTESRPMTPVSTLSDPFAIAGDREEESIPCDHGVEREEEGGERTLVSLLDQYAALGHEATGGSSYGDTNELLGLTTAPRPVSSVYEDEEDDEGWETDHASVGRTEADDLRPISLRLEVSPRVNLHPLNSSPASPPFAASVSSSRAPFHRLPSEESILTKHLRNPFSSPVVPSSPPQIHLKSVSSSTPRIVRRSSAVLSSPQSAVEFSWNQNIRASIASIRRPSAAAVVQASEHEDFVEPLLQTGKAEFNAIERPTYPQQTPSSLPTSRSRGLSLFPKPPTVLRRGKKPGPRRTPASVTGQDTPRNFLLSTRTNRSLSDQQLAERSKYWRLAPRGRGYQQAHETPGDGDMHDIELGNLAPHTPIRGTRIHNFGVNSSNSRGGEVSDGNAFGSTENLFPHQHQQQLQQSQTTTPRQLEQQQTQQSQAFSPFQRRIHTHWTRNRTLSPNARETYIRNWNLLNWAVLVAILPLCPLVVAYWAGVFDTGTFYLSGGLVQGVSQRQKRVAGWAAVVSAGLTLGAILGVVVWYVRVMMG